MAGGSFPISPSQIMIIECWQEFLARKEQTKPDAETARVMQIFVAVRIPSILAPSIQLRNLEAPVLNTWRFLVGPEVRTHPRSFETTCAFTISISKQGFGSGS